MRLDALEWAREASRLRITADCVKGFRIRNWSCLGRSAFAAIFRVPDRIGSGHITCSFGGMARNGVFRLVPFTPLMAPFAVVILELAFGSGMAPGPPPAFAKASTWMVDPGHAAAQCTLRHIVVATGSGEFAGPVCTVTFDPASLPTLKADVAFDTMRVNTRNADRAKDLRTRPVLRRRESLLR
jgi:hypothetical protein